MVERGSSVAEPNDDGFADRALSSFRELFWNPEIERRGGADTVGPVHQALAILNPGEPVEVRFNEEFTLVAKAKVNAPIARGEPVTTANLEYLEALEPVGVDPNAGWVAWILLPDGREHASFDFVRNRAHSLRLLALATEYMETAESAADAGRPGPAAENAMAAAELAVEAQAFMFDDDAPRRRGGRRTHSKREHWTKVQVGLGNTTPDAHATLIRLHRLRAAARYGEDTPLSRDEITNLLASARALVDDGARRVGKPLRTQDPEFLSSLDLPNH